jgi:hypothetical protein
MTCDSKINLYKFKLGPSNNLTPQCFIEVSVPIQICVLGVATFSLFLHFAFWNYSDIMVFFVFHFIIVYLCDHLLISHIL